jgi:hypothetical protein
MLSGLHRSDGTELTISEVLEGIKSGEVVLKEKK